MATADDYAAWIVKNADKKGTPDFDTVVQAYQQAKADESRPTARVVPSEGVSTLGDVGKSALYAPAKAVAGFVGLPADLQRIGPSVREWAYNKLPDSWRPALETADKIGNALSPIEFIGSRSPTSGQIRSGVEKVTGPWYDPQTRAGKIADTALQTATMFGKPSLSSLPAILGITAGTEGAGALTDDNPGARLAGGLLGGGIPAVASAIKGRPGVQVREALGKVTPEDIAKAKAMEARALEMGVPLMGTESFDRGHQMASAVLANPTGNPIVEPFLRSRVGKIQPAVDERLLGITGPRDLPEVNAARAQKAATASIAAEEAARTSRTSPMYKAAATDQASAADVESIVAAAKSAAKDTDPEYGKALTKFAHDITDPVKLPPKTSYGGGVEPMKDEYVTAIRKFGGINPADERVGTLAQHMPFPPSPRYGPVWRSPQYNTSASGNRSATTAGHSVDEMAAKLYEAGYISDRNALDEVLTKLDDSLMGKPQFSAYYEPVSSDPLAAAIDKLSEQLSIKNAPPVPREAATGVGRLSDTYKRVRNQLEMPSISADSDARIAQGVLGPYNAQLKAAIEKGSPQWKEANDLYRQITEQRIDPLTAGPVGLVAGKRGYVPGEQSPVPRVVSSISNVEAVRPDTIRTLYTHLNAQDKQAFPGIVQTHIENQLNSALKDLRSGPSYTAGAKFRNALVGTPYEQANFNEYIRGTAIARGVSDPDAVVRGANNFLEVLDRSGRTPGIGSQTAPREEFTRGMKQTWTGDIANTISVTPLKPTAHRFTDWITRGRYQKVAEALTARDSVDQLVKLSKLNPNSVPAQYLVASMLGVDRAIADGR